MVTEPRHLPTTLATCSPPFHLLTSSEGRHPITPTLLCGSVVLKVLRTGSCSCEPWGKQLVSASCWLLGVMRITERRKTLGSGKELEAMPTSMGSFYSGACLRTGHKLFPGPAQGQRRLEECPLLLPRYSEKSLRNQKSLQKYCCHKNFTQTHHKFTHRKTNQKKIMLNDYEVLMANVNCINA